MKSQVDDDQTEDRGLDWKNSFQPRFRQQRKGNGVPREV